MFLSSSLLFYLLMISCVFWVDRSLVFMVPISLFSPLVDSRRLWFFSCLVLFLSIYSSGVPLWLLVILVMDGSSSVRLSRLPRPILTFLFCPFYFPFVHFPPFLFFLVLFFFSSFSLSLPFLLSSKKKGRKMSIDGAAPSIKCCF